MGLLVLTVQEWGAKSGLLDARLLFHEVQVHQSPGGRYTGLATSGQGSRQSIATICCRVIYDGLC